MKKLFLNLQIIFSPEYWIMNKIYNKELDLFVNKLLDKHDFEDIGYYTAKLGGIEFWIANRPYGSMTIHMDDYYSDLRPSRKTIKRAFDKLDGESQNECKEEIKKLKRIL